MTGSYARVTIAADQRNVEMLLPSDRAVGELIPEILQICAPPAPRQDAQSLHHPKALGLTPMGAATLGPGESLDEAGVGNGAILTLDPRDEAVPRPVIYDVTEETERLSVPGTSTVQVDLNRLLSTTVFVLFGVTTLVVTTQVFDVSTPSWWSLVVSALALAALGVIPHRVFAWDLELLGLSAASLGLTYYWEPPDFSWSEWSAAGWLLLALAAWLGSRRLVWSLLVTASAAAILIGLWWGSWQLFSTDDQVTAAAGIGSVVLLGLAPRLALTASGLNRLDDDVTHGDRPGVPRAHTAFTNAHAGLAAAVILCAASAAAAVYGLVAAGFTRWSVPLAILLTVLTAVRARSMPLAVERTALVAAASVGAILILQALAGELPAWVLITVPALLALMPALLRMVNIPSHQHAKLRIYARRIEALATLALVPLLVGLFGVYSQLLATFQE